MTNFEQRSNGLLEVTATLVRVKYIVRNNKFSVDLTEHENQRIWPRNQNRGKNYNQHASSPVLHVTAVIIFLLVEKHCLTHISLRIRQMFYSFVEQKVEQLRRVWTLRLLVSGGFFCFNNRFGRPCFFHRRAALPRWQQAHSWAARSKVFVSF